MAEAGVFYLTIIGGEILMRRDFFEILEHARLRTFCIKLKTNGILYDEGSGRIKALGVETVQIQYLLAHPRVHDAITSCQARSSSRSIAITPATGSRHSCHHG